MSQDLYLTPPNSVWEITELGGLKRQPFGMKAFPFLILIPVFFPPLVEEPTPTEIQARHSEEVTSVP